MLKEYKTILLDEVDSVAILKLNRPEKLNAFNMQMFDDMLDAIDLVNNNDNIKSLVITGSGRAFCAGADLSFGEDCFGLLGASGSEGFAPAFEDGSIWGLACSFDTLSPFARSIGDGI